MQTFNVKAPGEKVALTYMMANGLATGETLTTPITIAVTTLYGSDPNPSAILNGGPGLDSTSTQVIVPVQGGLDHTIYEVTVTVPTTNPKKTLVLSASLPVRNGL